MPYLWCWLRFNRGILKTYLESFLVYQSSRQGSVAWVVYLLCWLRVNRGILKTYISPFRFSNHLGMVISSGKRELAVLLIVLVAY